MIGGSSPADPPLPLESPRFTSAPAGVAAWSTTRAGGVSSAPYDTLNLGAAVGDDSVRVRENRRRAAAAMGFDLASAALVRQVHGAEIVCADAATAGRGLVTESAIPDADALATDVRGLALIVGMADCVPVFLAAADGRAIALAHAGWRGVVADVVPRTLEILSARYGVLPSETVAAFGPSIGPCCFEVGEDVASVFASRFPGSARNRRVDLAAAIRRQLADAGVPREAPSPPCTRCHADRYFSHRAAGGIPSGRMWAVLRRL